ncbi:MAG: hypothetical protein IKN94_07080 [Salinivirgaceae bacterium]|nr:hypothetical protein [Salinivirgaceae bacterium]
MREYNRNSLTILLVEGGKYSSELKTAMNTVAVPEKFDNNMLEQRVMPGSANSEALRRQLESMKVPNKIFSKWFSRSDDGRFDMTVVYNRGLYNASDADVIKAAAAKLGMAKLKDAGEKLIKQSYVLVLCFGTIKTMDQIYDEMDAARRKTAKIQNKEFKPVARTKNGYRGEVAGFLYRLSDVPQAMDNFYSNMWIYDEDAPDVVAAKRQMFDTTSFQLVKVTQTTTTYEASQYNTGEQKSESELFSMLVNGSVHNLVRDFENKVEEWKVRTALYSVFPLRAKIGTKENLTVEDRYFVYELRMNKNNQVYADRRGVVRAKKVVNNSQMAQGNTNENLKQTTSKFYQIAGHKLEPGMYLEQSNDMGIGVTIGGAGGSLGGAYINIEGLVGQYVGITQLKFFMGGHLGFNSYKHSKWGGDKLSMMFYGGEVGFSKGFFIMRNVSVSGQAGIAMEWGDALDRDVKKQYLNDCLVEGLFCFAGAQLAVNIRYDLQLVGGLNYYAEMGNASLTKNAEESDSKDMGIKYSELFDGRAGTNINLGVRIQF